MYVFAIHTPGLRRRAHQKPFASEQVIKTLSPKLRVKRLTYPTDHSKHLAFLNIGFGPYSEYHLYAAPKAPVINLPSRGFQLQFFNYLNLHFTVTHWLASIDAASSEYSPQSNSTPSVNLLALNVILRERQCLIRITILMKCTIKCRQTAKATLICDVSD